MSKYCKVCKLPLQQFKYASNYRIVGYCPKHLPENLKCQHPGCNLPARRNKIYCKSHRKFAERKPQPGKVRCAAITTSGRQCRNLVSPELVYCPVHKDKETAPLKVKDYSKYIQSSAWTTKSKQVRKEYDNRCRLCNRTGIIHAHHRTYERLGIELPTDLTPLCEDCHSLFGVFYTYDNKTHTFKPNAKFTELFSKSN